jgi:SAM-dependent methyltransferase
LQQSNKALERDDSRSDIEPRWDHSTHEHVFDYYAEASVSDDAVVRFGRIRDAILRVMGRRNMGMLDLADIGCGAESRSMAWAELGCRVHALDVNEPLITLARTRAAERRVSIDFRVGSATALAWATRVLRPGGALFLTTTNRLCPRQAESNLVSYRWYPNRLKNHFQRLAITTRPELVNYARYPVVHWFTFYGLRRFLSARRLRSLDLFDVIHAEEKGALATLVLAAVKRRSILRYAGQVCTPGTCIMAMKDLP